MVKYILQKKNLHFCYVFILFLIVLFIYNTCLLSNDNNTVNEYCYEDNQLQIIDYKLMMEKKIPNFEISNKNYNIYETMANLRNIAPFNQSNERYMKVFKTLLEKGFTYERINKIFTSKRLQKDIFPVNKISEKVISKPFYRKKNKSIYIAKKIKVHIKKYKKNYDTLEKIYNVNKEIAASILYKETALGEFSNWQHDSFNVLNSVLSFIKLSNETDYRLKKRKERIIATAQNSLIGLLLYCDKYNISIEEKIFPSSFAGAIGVPQFMPMYLDYALSASNNIPDLNKIPDAILSLGNILVNKFAWPGYIYFNKLKDIDKIVMGYYNFDKNVKNASLCMNIDLDGFQLNSFYDSNNNFSNFDYICNYVKCLMNYNYSSTYALDVILLAYYATL